MLHRLGRSVEAAQLHSSMASLSEPDDNDRQLITHAAALRRALEAGESR